MTILTFEHSPSTYLRLLKWHRLTCISITATTVGVVYTVSKLQREKLKNLKQIRTKNWFSSPFIYFAAVNSQVVILVQLNRSKHLTERDKNCTPTHEPTYQASKKCVLKKRARVARIKRRARWARAHGFVESQILGMRNEKRPKI